MISVPSSDHINVRSWESLCDTTFEPSAGKGAEPPPGVVFCYAKDIPELFRLHTSNKYVVVTANNDLGLHLQCESHPNKDFLKVIKHHPDWPNIFARRDQYMQVGFNCPINQATCRPTDRYSFKFDHFTDRTFNDIPPNVAKWFIVNCNVRHFKTVPIPFGVNVGTELDPELVRPPEKHELLYVNFQPHTDLRVSLLNHYRQASWATTRPKCGVPVKEYWAEMADHHFVLCPPGVGLDCYRNYEALYLGCVPVVERSTFSQRIFCGLPVLVVDSLFDLTPGFLRAKLEEMKGWEYKDEFVRLSYWKRQVEQARSLTLS
jgi:hypothetical protein